MNKQYILLVFTVLFLCACRSTNKAGNSNQQMDEYLTGQADYFRFNGNVLVAEKGKVIFQKSYGFADFDTKRLLNDSSVFELASLSKQFTATAILLLKDNNKLKLTDSLRQFFPELPYNGITLYHMLTHTSGLPDYEEAMNHKWDKSKIAFNADMIAFLAKEKPPIVFAPGSRWEYSNTAYAILASIVEKLSGQTFAAFLAKNIFQPLGMTHTRIYNTRRSLKDTIPNYAYGYVYNDSLKKHAMPDSVPDFKFVIYLDGIQGDGVVNSTTADLLTWDRAVKNHTLLNEVTQQEMLKEQALADTVKKVYYGFGVFLEKTEAGMIISHSGGWPGYTTFLARNAALDQTFIILSNNSSNSPALTKALQQLLNGQTLEMPYKHEEIQLDSVQLQKFTGKFKTTNEFSIERNGDKLYRTIPSGQKIELKPESSNKFFYTDGTDRQILFETDTNQQVIKGWLISYGLKTEIQRKK
jgi:CubicO group peptidase (beta-lactamase class C family)